MSFLMQPWHLLVLSLASWLNREQRQVIEYLQVENRVLLKEHYGNKLLTTILIETIRDWKTG